MKSLKHHIRQFLRRMVQAETVQDREEARKVLRKAEKHQRKIEKLSKSGDQQETI